jgi:hypothetical protein
MAEALIDRLKRRIQSEPTVDLEVCPPIRPHPPVSAAQLAEAEERLGFELPPIVRDLYTQVADGGYGPGYGLNRLIAGDSLTLVLSDQTFLEERATGDPLSLWPDKFLRLCEWGCNYFSGIDCSRPACPIVRFVPDWCAEGAAMAEVRVPEADSLEEWLEAWLRGERLWERVVIP